MARSGKLKDIERDRAIEAGETVCEPLTEDRAEKPNGLYRR